MHGAPIVYGLTIPKSAPNAAGGARFAEVLLGEEGRRIFERSGFRPLVPAVAGDASGLPASLRPLVRKP